MQRATIRWPVAPTAINARRGTAAQLAAAAAPPPPPKPAAPPAADIAPLLQNIAMALLDSEQRRSQSLGELQQVALELAIAVTSQLVFHSIEQDQFAVEGLVQAAIDKACLRSPPVISLHPADLELLNRRLAGKSAPWQAQQVEFRSDASISRGGCAVESLDGPRLVSDVATRLSEIRRHWMEELDDAQVERRGAAGESPALRRFPDRRETA